MNISVQTLERYHLFTESPAHNDSVKADRRYKEVGEWILKNTSAVEADLRTHATPEAVQALVDIVFRERAYGGGWRDLRHACERLFLSTGSVGLPIIKAKTENRALGSFFELIYDQMKGEGPLIDPPNG